MFYLLCARFYDVKILRHKKCRIDISPGCWHRGLDCLDLGDGLGELGCEVGWLGWELRRAAKEADELGLLSFHLVNIGLEAAQMID